VTVSPNDSPVELGPLELTNHPSLCSVFQETAARHPARPALRTAGDEISWTWGDYAERVEAVARGLAALGIGCGDTVAMLLRNRPEFHVVDAAAMHLGAACLSVYNTLPAGDVAWELDDAGAKLLFTETALLEAALGARESGAAVPIVLVDGDHDATLSLERLVAGGSPDFDFDAAWRAVQQSDVATIIYTSGTTATPKGVELTHGSILGNLESLHARIGTVDGARVVSYLPMAHIAERQFSQYRAMAAGLQVTTCAEPRDVGAHLVAVRPHYLFAPTRILDKMRSAVGAVDAGALSDVEKAAVLSNFGLDQVRVAVIGAAPVPRELSEFWIALGLPLIEGWGCTECGAFAAFGIPGDYTPGTCGPALPGVEVRLAVDGELLIRSPWLMRGYRGHPELTAETIDADGWLHTGDIGAFDDRGNVSIVDRKKEIIINAAGKNMSPARIESKLKAAHPLIGDVCVVGDRRPYLVALIVPDPESAASFDGDVAAVIAEGVARANHELARVEQIKRFDVLEEQWVPGEEMTPTMKLKRRVIESKYADVIDSLYQAKDGQE